MYYYIIKGVILTLTTSLIFTLIIYWFWRNCLFHLNEIDKAKIARVRSFRKEIALKIPEIHRTFGDKFTFALFKKAWSHSPSDYDKELRQLYNIIIESNYYESLFTSLSRTACNDIDCFLELHQPYFQTFFDEIQLNELFNLPENHLIKKQEL